MAFKPIGRLPLLFFFAGAASGLVLSLMGFGASAVPFFIAGLVSFALFCAGHPKLKAYTFTAWVLVFVAASLAYPAAFRSWAGRDLKVLIVPLIQVITFGMGTTLSLKDFERVLAMPGPVLVGIVLQFTVMPLVGLGIATIFGFEPEVAAGVVLVGSVSGGVASNLITYLARGNVALSVTMTACSTLLSPVMTPLMMKVLAGRLVPVRFLAMMISILDMIIVPIVAGLVAHRILYGSRDKAKDLIRLPLQSAACLASTAFLILVPASTLGPLASLKRGLVLGFLLVGITALVKFIVGLLKGPENWMDRALPAVSMAGICIIIAIITAQSRDQLLSVGPLLVAAAVLHNGGGYLLGYWGARLIRLNERDSRTVAIEVGMQNGGMASGIAIDVLKSASAALAPAIFGPWMNVSGSVLASWWRRKSI